MPILKNKFGEDVSYTVNRDGSLNLNKSWVDRNITRVLVPQLKNIQTYGGKFSGNVTFYKKAVPQLLAAFDVIEKLGFKEDILFWDGSFVPRMKRGSKTSPSNHTLGTAFDINAEWNGFHKTPAPLGSKGSVQRLLPIFRALGWTCGADWKNTPDGMHFEIHEILSASDIEEVKSKLIKSNTPTLKLEPEEEPEFCVLDGDLIPMLMVKNKVYVELDSMLEERGEQVIATSNKLALPLPRFYVNSKPKLKF